MSLAEIKDTESQQSCEPSAQLSHDLTPQENREEREYARLREMIPGLSNTEESLSKTDIVQEAARYIGELHDRVRDTLSHPDDILQAREFLTHRLTHDLQYRRSIKTSGESLVLTPDGLRPQTNRRSRITPSALSASEIPAVVSTGVRNSDAASDIPCKVVQPPD